TGPCPGAARCSAARCSPPQAPRSTLTTQSSGSTFACHWLHCYHDAASGKFTRNPSTLGRRLSLLRPILLNALTGARKIAAIDDNRTTSYGQLLGGALFIADRIEQSTARPHVGILLPTGGAF